MSHDRPFIVRLFVRNRAFKLLSLALALITWFAIQQTINFETVIADIPVVVEVDEGWAVLDISTDSVDVHFMGSQEDLVKLRREYLSVELDVRGLEGSSTIDLKPSHVKAPAGVRASYIQPSSIDISLDREAQKQIPVRADVPARAPEGFQLERVVCVPASVLVSGPEQRLKNIEMVKTEPVTFDGRKGSFRERVPIVAPSKTWVANVEPDRVNVEVTLTESSEKKTLNGVNVRVLAPSGRALNSTVNPTEVQVELKGRTAVLQDLEAEDVNAFVDCTGLETAARYDLPVQVVAPDGAQVSTVKPDFVTLQLEYK